MAYGPFSELLGLEILKRENGVCHSSMKVETKHVNSTNVVHGGAIFSLADTTMGNALESVVPEGQLIATIELKINYFKPIFGGVILGHAKIVNRGKRLANIECSLYVDEILVANANGNYMIIHR